MSLTINDPNVPIRFDHGAVRIGPTRITLEVLLAYYNQGMNAEQLVHSFPTLDLADVYSVLAYYLRNRHDIDAWLTQREAAGAEIRLKIESQPGYAEKLANLQERITAVKAARMSAPRT